MILNDVIFEEIVAKQKANEDSVEMLMPAKIHCLKYVILPNFLEWKFCRNAPVCAEFPKNFHTRKNLSILCIFVYYQIAPE